MKNVLEKQLSWFAIFMTAFYSCEYFLKWLDNITQHWSQSEFGGGGGGGGLDDVEYSRFF